ncbi:Phytosulfokine [Quillaja saponaria]|uniref:Phytosulfokine n=1 Tax=Quillaja saponaria TaxID=32244 RepID=A0AAD7VD33_QUISA|nr:Phytosulfokine [Quillaja saponaria]
MPFIHLNHTEQGSLHIRMKTMKQQNPLIISPFFLLLLLLLSSSFASSLSSSSSPAPPAPLLIAAKQDGKEVKAINDHTSHARSSLKELIDDLDVMGSEECDEKDEECLKRRMIGEAHLDYIYTQYHKP